ncbi:MAG: FMN-binding protein [Candidatus Caldatribacteriaceae bacterium]
MKRGWKVFLIIVAALLGFLGIAFGYLYSGLNPTLNLTIGTIDLAHVEDGTYRGRYTQGRFDCEVEVTVKGHAIEDITFIKLLPFFPGELHEEIAKRVKGPQSLGIDTITKATASSKAVLKAIENALKR